MRAREWPGRLYQIAESQLGSFTAAQARVAGVHQVRLIQLHHSGDIQRVSRGVYRLVRFPLSPLSQYMEAALWPRVRRPDARGVIPYVSALALPAGPPPSAGVLARYARVYAEELGVSEGRVALRPRPANAIMGDGHHCRFVAGVPALSCEQSAMDAISANDWRRIEHVLDTALTLPADERATYVTKACAGDDALAAQVEALIALTDKPSIFDSSAAVYAAPVLEVAAPASEAAREEVEGNVFGEYRVVREIARGGMGTVYLAHRVNEPVEHRVALKVVGSGRRSHELHRRFLVERQILARLSHPHIARLLDEGVTDDGQPWFAMEYIDGAHITEHCDAHRLTVSDRLRLFRSVCEAVHFAHANLVVHRDLKPSNILVTADGVVKLLDFGIAKAFGPEALMQPRMSLAGQRLMTPEYAAPEQVCGEAVSVATDVYSLAAVLFELLSGRRVHYLEPGARGEIVDVLSSGAPERPSDAVVRPPPERWPSNKSWPTAAEVAEQRSTTPERLRRQLSRGLDSIVLKALAKDPAQRYPSAEALRDDLARTALESEAS